MENCAIVERHTMFLFPIHGARPILCPPAPDPTKLATPTGALSGNNVQVSFPAVSVDNCCGNSRDRWFRCSGFGGCRPLGQASGWSPVLFVPRQTKPAGQIATGNDKNSKHEITPRTIVQNDWVLKIHFNSTTTTLELTCLPWYLLLSLAYHGSHRSTSANTRSKLPPRIL